ncbi:hypothetical protein JKF63_07756 [Porcisia hertigi]|uniref:Uncharacterized protein n=1 Tax=Porcisia hertigi TaxID=2761500 RepID=A0A836LLR8_9TRYP|nr:hypothetical protein JKF63_07756 [Porcisia hertigi]
MPTKEYIQLLQKLFVYFKRNGGQNVPHGISQIALIDDDDLTRWFVQLVYKDENKADFYVSLELVFSEDGDDDDDGMAGGAWNKSAGVEGGMRGSAHQRPSQHVGPSASARALAAAKPSAGAAHASVAAPQSSASTSSSHAHPHDTMTAGSSPPPLTLRSSSLAPAGPGGTAQAATACSRCGEETPGVVTSLLDDKLECRPLALGEVKLPQSTSSGSRRPPEDAVTSPTNPTASNAGSRRTARMPLVFVVAPRLIASFIHHGALCSLELMSQQWELSAENLLLLLIALFETLNPFAGDGRVSVDDAERIASRREAVAVAEGSASISAGAYSEEEHQLGMDYIRRAHPHLFRRYVGPLATSISEPRNTVPHGKRSTNDDDDNDDVAVAGGSAAVRSSALGGGTPSSPLASGSRNTLVAPSTPSPVGVRTGKGNDGGSGCSASAPHVLRDVSHLNTAVYDALVTAYAARWETTPAPARPPSPPASPVFPPPPRQCPAAATATPIVMLLDTPALLADAGRARQAAASTIETADGTDTATDVMKPKWLPGRNRADATFERRDAALSSRAGPPALSHIAYAPTRQRRAAASAAAADGGEPPLLQRVAELWIPLTLPPPPPPPSSIRASSTAAVGVSATRASGGSAITQLQHLSEAGVSCDGAAGNDAVVPFPLEVHLIGDADDNVEEARVACVLRNVRVSPTTPRRLSSRCSPRLDANDSVGNSPSTSTTYQRPAQQQLSSLSFSLDSSTAPSPAGDVHTCRIPRGLTLRCSNLYIYGHLRVLGNLVLDNCIFVGTLTTEELASVQVSHSYLALMPNDGLLLLRRRRQPQQPPPPDRLYALRKECVLILDSSQVGMSDDTHLCRLMPDVDVTEAAAACGRRWSRLEANTETCSGDPNTASRDRRQGADTGGLAVVRDDEEDCSDEENTVAVQPAAPMMPVLRSLILVSNQGRLRLVRCTVHPGRNTERSIFAEQDAIVDMAYCTVTAAIYSAVSVQGCRAYLEHCLFEGSPTTADAAAESGSDDMSNGGGHGAASGHRGIQEQRSPPPPILVNDETRSTGLNVELGGTLTARHCMARHLYFAFCAIAHSVAHFYCCHAEDVVNGFTVDASAATLDGCSARTNHVGAFILHKAKCILTDDRHGGFAQRCRCLGEAHETAHRVVSGVELQYRQQEGMKGDALPRAPAETESLWAAAAAVAKRTARVALLARRHYAEQLRRSATPGDAAPATAMASDSPEYPSPTASEMSSPEQTLGFFGGRFSLEVRDAALKAIGVTLMNAYDTCVYAYEGSTVELEECVLWSTAEAEAAANGAVATAAAAAPSTAEWSTTAASATMRTLMDRSALYGAEVDTASSLRSGSPRQRSCGVNVVHAHLKARRCLTVGYSFGFAAIQSAHADLQECLVLSAMNGYTIDHSQCRLRHCGADTSHVGLFALNNSRVEAESTPHVVGVSSSRRAAPPRICGGVPAVFGGDVYGVEIQSSEMQCTGVRVLRGRDSGFNVYNSSVLRLSKCLVDMSPTDAASYVFHHRRSSGDIYHHHHHRRGKGGKATAGKRGDSSTDQDGPVSTAGSWTHHLNLGVGLAEVVQHGTGDSDANQMDHSDDDERSGDEVDGGDIQPAASAPVVVSSSAPSTTALGARSADTSGVKVWSGSQCHTYDTEVRCVTFGFASLGPGTLLEAHHCAAKHVVNGFTSDGGALRLTKCSANSNHVGVYILSHAHCVVRRGSYAGKQYGIECRSGVLSLQGHVKIYGFSRIGLYLYDGAHCEADPDCVLDIHALKHAAPQSSTASSAAVASVPAPSVAGGPTSSTRPPPLWERKKRQPLPPVATASIVSRFGLEDAASMSELRPACIALAEATAHLPQALLGGGARCGITCGDGATGFIGKCIVYDCTLVGVNVFAGAHLTLANGCLLCEQQYAVVVRDGGVCRITRNAEGDKKAGMDDGSSDVDDCEGEEGAAAGKGRDLRRILRRHGLSTAALGAALGHLKSCVARVAAMSWRVARQWAVQRDWNGGATPAAGTGTAARISRDGRSAGKTGLAPCAPTATAPPITNSSDGTYGAGGTLRVDNEDEEVGGRRVMSPPSALQRRRLKWLCWEAHLRTQLAFQLNQWTMSAATTHAGGTAAREPGNAVAGAEKQRQPPSPLPSRSAASGHSRATVLLPGAAAAASEATAIGPVFPPVRPVICGSCVVYGTCTMERVVLQPTSHLPARLFSECGYADKDKGVMSTEAAGARNVASARAPRSLWTSQGGRTSSSPQRQAESNNSADSTIAATTGNSDGVHASQTMESLATADTTDDTAALPSVRVLQHLAHQPSGVHVCQQGLLSLTDCVVDVSLSSQPCLGGRYAEQLVSAVMKCEGPCAKLHCDYVRVVRGERSGEEDCSVTEGRGSGAPGAAQPVTSSPSTSPEASPVLSADATPPLSARCADVIAAAAEIATVPLLLISLVKGAECRLHMVGTSLDDWPYSAYRSTSTHNDGNAVCGDPVMRTREEVGQSMLVSTGCGGSAVTQTTPPAAHTATHNAGVMVCATGDTLTHAAYANIAAILASQRSQVRLSHCTVTGGMMPFVLGSGSYASLTFCRVVGGARAGPTAAAIRVEGGSNLTLLRSSVWTLSQGPAVECIHDGRLQAMGSEELTLGTGGGGGEGSVGAGTASVK